MTKWRSVKDEPPPMDGTPIRARIDGKIVEGALVPFWCGSDCPCDEEWPNGSEPFNAKPVCWTIGDPESYQNPYPTEWAPLLIPPETAA